MAAPIPAPPPVAAEGRGGLLSAILQKISGLKEFLDGIKLPDGSLLETASANHVTGDVILRVEIGGDDGNAGRPSFITEGDHTAYPFETLAAARAALPVFLTYPRQVKIQMGPGTFVGADVRGFAGGGEFVLEFDVSELALTGEMNGTAGAGTTSTTLLKPSGGDNWVADELIGYVLQVVSGGGAGGTSIIIDNTTTAVTVDPPITGMGNDTVFRIVEGATLLSAISEDDLTCLRIRDNHCQVHVRFARFAGTILYNHLVESIGNDDVRFEGCSYEVDTIGPAFYSLRDKMVRTDATFRSNGARSKFVQGYRVEVGGQVLDGASSDEAVDCFTASVTAVQSDGATSSVLIAKRLHSLEMEINASNGAATPVLLESVANSEAVGAKLRGSNNTGFGIQMDRHGRAILVGCSISGTDASGNYDLNFFNNAVSWAVMSNPGLGGVETYAGSAVGSWAATKFLWYGNRTGMGNLDLSGRMLEYGYHNFSQEVGITATGTNKATARQLGANFLNRVDTTPSGTGVKMFDNAALPGVLGLVFNAGANELLLYAPDGANTIDGADSIGIPANSLCFLVSTGNDGKSFRTIITT